MKVSAQNVPLRDNQLKEYAWTTHITFNLSSLDVHRTIVIEGKWFNSYLGRNRRIYCDKLEPGNLKLFYCKGTDDV